MKQQRQLAPSTIHLAQELLTNVQSSGGSISFTKEMRALKMRSVWPAIGSWRQLRTIIEADPLTTAWQVAEELNVDHSTVIQCLKQIGKVKKLDKWVPHELNANQKNCHFEVLLSLILCNNNEPFLYWIVTCDGKWILYDNWLWPAKVAGPRRSSKLLPKAKLAPRKGHCHCLVVCCLSDSLQLSESQGNHYIWGVCSANQQDALKTAVPAAYTGQQKGPNSSPWLHPTACCPTNASEVEWIGLQSLASSAIFTWPFASWQPLLQASWQHSAEKTLLQPAGCRKCFPRVCQISKHRFLCCRKKLTYFSLAEMC